LAGIGLMAGGIALVGVVTAALASWFVDHVMREERTEVQLHAQVAGLVEEVRLLRAQLDGLAGACEHRGSGEEPGTSVKR
jgi:voltage-gated potassium channel